MEWNLNKSWLGSPKSSQNELMTPSGCSDIVIAPASFWKARSFFSVMLSFVSLFLSIFLRFRKWRKIPRPKPAPLSLSLRLSAWLDHFICFPTSWSTPIFVWFKHRMFYWCSEESFKVPVAVRNLLYVRGSSLRWPAYYLGNYFPPNLIYLHPVSRKAFSEQSSCW